MNSSSNTNTDQSLVSFPVKAVSTLVAMVALLAGSAPGLSPMTVVPPCSRKLLMSCELERTSLTAMGVFSVT